MTLPPKESKQEPQNRFPFSPLPNHAFLPLTHDLTLSCIGWLQVGYKLVRFGPYACLFSMYVQNLLAAHAFAVIGLHSLPSIFDYFLISLSFMAFPIQAGPCLTVGFAFLQSTFFPGTISYHTTLSFLLRNCFALIWLGLFGPAVYSSSNGPVQPLVLLLYHWQAPVSHLFSLGHPGPVCFPWASSALFLNFAFPWVFTEFFGLP